MAKTRIALTFAAGLLLATPFAAAAPPPAAEEPPWPPETSPFAEDDLRLMFDSLRDAFIDSLRGQRAQPSPELRDRMEELRRKLEGEANVILREMLQGMQRDLDRALEELRQRQPPPEPKPERTRL
jgi:hypothetical protein